MTQKKPAKKAGEMTTKEIAKRALPKELRDKIKREANPPKPAKKTV